MDKDLRSRDDLLVDWCDDDGGESEGTLVLISFIDDIGSDSDESMCDSYHPSSPLGPELPEEDDATEPDSNGSNQVMARTRAAIDVVRQSWGPPSLPPMPTHSHVMTCDREELWE